MSEDLKKLIPKLTLLSAPLLILMLMYWFFDPFKVMHSYTNYYPKENSFVTINKDYATLEILKNQIEKDKYDSFILGSSRSMFFESNDWKKHINDSNIFHFDASGESLAGVWQKISYLDRQNIQVKNILWIVDADLLTKTDDYTDYLYIKDPELAESSWLRFHYKHFESFCTFKFIKAYVDYSLHKTYKPYMKDFIMNKRDIVYNPLKNEFYFKEIEEWIKKDSAGYYGFMKDQFYKRDSIQKICPSILVHKEQVEMLNEIGKIIEKKKINCKILISPLYNEIKINPHDISLLKEIFGSKAVYDFSGKSSITKRMTNYYENSHYRPHVSRFLLDSIYKTGS